MRNLHKYYYKDYFSEHIEDVDKNNDDKLSFEYLYLSEEKENEPDKEKKKELSEKTSLIEKKNMSVLEFRNTKLTGTDFVKKDQQGRPTRKLLEDAYIYNEVAPNDDKNRFPLEIQYPGLVTGVGISHKTKITGEFKLGVHFDWTYGMPVVYGSSVKGVLRAWFIDTYYTSKEKYYECGIDGIDLMMEIFSGSYDRDVVAEKEKYGDNWEKKVKDPDNRIYKSRRSIYDRDVFFDAVIVKADPNGRILCSDSITPHLQGPLKNPIPITFLKIAPGCKLEFRFKLHNSDFGEDKIFTAELKKTLFKEILTTVGIGAKTNVGYGQLK